ncbi:hypothetical protein Pelo_7920 [Pelomyxa schiedti]|nr:hypothetical protein Pelo_7920 [Pelomyxa schiedti]
MKNNFSFPSEEPHLSSHNNYGPELKLFQELHLFTLLYRKDPRRAGVPLAVVISRAVWEYVLSWLMQSTTAVWTDEDEATEPSNVFSTLSHRGAHMKAGGEFSLVITGSLALVEVCKALNGYEDNVEGVKWLLNHAEMKGVEESLVENLVKKKNISTVPLLLIEKFPIPE